MFIEVHGTMVHAAVYGAGEPTTVGLAGAFGNLEIWQPPFEMLHHSFRTVAIDHLGTGQTRVAPERVTFEGQVALVPAVLDALGIERCVLAGDSSLSAVALAVADRWPERVDRLVLVAGKIDHAPDERTRAFVTALRGSFDATVEGFVAYCLPEDERGHLRAWLYDIIARTGPERAARLVESFYDVEVRSLLRGIEMPALVVHGARDAVTSVDEARVLAAELPNSELVILDDAGHVPTLSRPTAVADAVTAFALAGADA